MAPGASHLARGAAPTSLGSIEHCSKTNIKTDCGRLLKSTLSPYAWAHMFLGTLTDTCTHTHG